MFLLPKIPGKNPKRTITKMLYRRLGKYFVYPAVLSIFHLHNEIIFFYETKVN